MTPEEKAKRYDEALEIARQYWNDRAMPIGTNFKLERMFPELRESEGERIRKAIVKMISDIDGGSPFEKYGIVKKEALAWLEKQGEKIEPIEGFNTEFEKQISHLIASAINREHKYNEGYVKWTANALLNFAKNELEKQGEKKYIDDLTQQEAMDIAVAKCFEQGEKKDIKEHNVCDFCEDRYGCVNPCPMKLIEKLKPTDKAEPKFNVGDWIIHNDSKHIPIKIIEKIGMYYRTVDTVNYYHNIWIDYINENYHLWTIQDAKDGDVLVLNNEVFIYAHRKQMYPIAVAQCFVDSAGGFYLDGEFGYKEHGNTISPAIKEQRDLLFQKMKESGYEWDPEKKKLKKIEQERTGWSEDDEKQARQIERIVHNDGCTQKLQKQIADWIKSIKDRVQPQTRQEWSEEDERNLNDAILFIETGTYSLDKDNLINWLKSFRPQNNITDEELAQAKKDAYNDALDKIEYHSGEPTFDDGWDAAIWCLKKRNAQPQNTWKPSDEQITWLYRAADDASKDSRMKQVLNNLLSDLKKLRDE